MVMVEVKRGLLSQFLSTTSLVLIPLSFFLSIFLHVGFPLSLLSTRTIFLSNVINQNRTWRENYLKRTCFQTELFYFLSLFLTELSLLTIHFSPELFIPSSPNAEKLITHTTVFFAPLLPWSLLKCNQTRTNPLDFSHTQYFSISFELFLEVGLVTQKM